MTNPSTHLHNAGDVGATSKVSMSKKRRTAVEQTYPSVDELSKSEVLQSCPGKKGGEVDLLGAIVVVPPALFGKRDEVSVTRVCVSERHLYYPDVVKGETVVGPIYQIATSVPLKRSVAIRIPFVKEERLNYEMKLKWKPEPSDENPNPVWSYMATFHFIKTLKGDFMELMTDTLGTFVAVSVLKTERFEITPQGCLYNSYTNRHINLRFPKKYLEKMVTWELVIWPIHMDRAEHTKTIMYTADCSEFIACSDFFELRSDDYNGEQFRRPVTVRVPLPHHLETDAENQVDRSDLSVLCKTGNDQDDWQLVDGPVKFTKDSVSFDVKRFTVFAIGQSKPGRGKRLQPAIPKIYQQNFRIQGDIATFLSLEKKKWFLWIEAVRGLDNTNAVVEKRTTQNGVNLKYEEYIEEAPEVKVEFRSSRRSFHTRRNIPDVPEPVTDNIEFNEGLSLVIDIAGDVETVDGENNSQKLPLYFSENSPENYRVLEIRPTTLEERKLTFTIAISKIDPVDKKYKRVRFQSIDIDEATVKNYFYVEPEPEPEPEPMEVEITISKSADQVSEKSSPDTKKTSAEKMPVMTNAFLRLTTPTKPRMIISKEPKVLSGKSLQVLAKQIPEGLTLAVYLNVPDSTITGIGFDALSNGLTLNMVTYKILLAWKRRTRPKDKLVDILVDALKDMGRYDITDVLVKKHQDNEELCPEDFL